MKASVKNKLKTAKFKPLRRTPNEESKNDNGTDNAEIS